MGRHVRSGGFQEGHYDTGHGMRAAQENVENLAGFLCGVADSLTKDVAPCSEEGWALAFPVIRDNPVAGRNMH